MGKYKVITCANWRFRRHIDAWLASVKMYMPECDPHIRVVNWPDGTFNHDCSHEIVNRKFPSDKLEKFYCAHQKAAMMQDALLDAVGVIWVDADSLVVKHATQLYDYMMKYNFSYIPKKSGRATASVMTAIRSNNTVAFLDNYRKLTGHIEKVGPRPWTADQEAINILVPRWKTRVKFGLIPYRLCDWRYHKEMTIYNAKGRDGRRDHTFIMLRDKALRKYELSKKEY